MVCSLLIVWMCDDFFAWSTLSCLFNVLNWNSEWEDVLFYNVYRVDWQWKEKRWQNGDS